MAKGPLVVSFTGGEVDRYTLARVDMEGAETRAERLENVFIIPSGAQELAPGTLHVGSTPGNAPARLRPWVRSEDLAFHLLLTALEMRLIYGAGFQVLAGADASIAAFTDESGAPSAGGGTAPGGTGLSVALSSSLMVANVETVTGSVSGGSGSYAALWEYVSGDSSVIPTPPNTLTTSFLWAGAYETSVTYRLRVTDNVTGEYGLSELVTIIGPGVEIMP